MPKIERSQWYDLTRDMKWHFKYVNEDEVFPKELSNNRDVPGEAWWGWDELLMLKDFSLDSKRSRDWSQALVKYAVAGRPQNKEVLKEWVDKWTPLVHRAAVGLAAAFAEAPKPMKQEDVTNQVGEVYKAFLANCDL